MSTSPILVVGAGPTGMTAAIELRRAGLEVRIIDKSKQPALYSQALVLQARTLEQMQRYGTAAKAVARGRQLKNVTIWSEGKSVLSLGFDRIPSRFPFLLFLPQSQTETILNEVMESLGVKAERGTELASFTDQGGDISAVLRHPEGREEQFRSSWIIGCDGAHSKVRKLAEIPFEGGGVGLSFFLGDLELEGPDASDEGLMLHWHRGDVVFMGRLNDRITRVIVALHAEQGSGDPPELSIKDFQRPIDRAGIRVKVRSSEWMTPFRVNDRQAKHYRSGRVFLAGDASHIHSPVGGQGMNTGIQDAANLAWKLAAVGRGANEKLLDSYEEERGEVGRALLRFTERGLKMATVSSPLLKSVRDAILPVIGGWEPIQKAVLGFLAETAIHYRFSSIVADRGGDGCLRAGDRMPDLTLADKDGSSTLLGDWTDPKHLAILFEGSDSEVAEVAARVTQARVVRLNSSDLDREGKGLLGTDKKLIIVRPDGYVGFRGRLDDSVEWEAYARGHALA